MSRYVDLNGVSWDGKPITSKIQEVQTKHGCMQGITIGWLGGDNVPHIDLEEHDKQIRTEVINEYYNEINEKLKADTNLKDTIRDIHDRVAQEMYCKGIDDFVNKINESNQGHWRPTRYEHGEVVSETMSYDIGTIRLIAEQLKAGEKNE